MRNSTLLRLFSIGVGSLLMLSSCKDDSYLATAPAVPDQSFVEEFDTVASAIARGWVLKNRSVPVGRNLNQANAFLQNVYGQWHQPKTTIDYPIFSVLSDPKPDIQFFPAYSSRATNLGYLFASYFSSYTEEINPGDGVISDWVISPVVTMQNGDKITFYTRAAANLDDFDFIDRMQVRLNIQDESTDCGLGIDPGKFSNAVLDINPNYASRPDANGYPSNWTKFVATVSGISGKSVKGRFAFRYYVNGGGTQASEAAFGIGLDKVTYTSVGH